MNFAIIAAKGKSVRIPGKNAKPFFGKPIIAYSIETAKASGLFECIIVSTDSPEIASIAHSNGAEAYMRRPELTEDRYGPLDVAGSVLFSYQYAHDTLPEYACCISATAPLMTVEDLHVGLETLASRADAQYAFGMGTEPPKDAGAWYWGKSLAFVRSLPLVEAHTIMVPVPRHRCCDIDEPRDWVRAELLYAAMQKAAAQAA